MINVADLKNPKTGKTYRQENSELVHNIPLGTLVEDIEDGIRLFVIYQGRDCDMEPIYWLSPYSYIRYPNNMDIEKLKWIGGYCEDSLKVIKKNAQNKCSHTSPSMQVYQRHKNSQKVPFFADRTFVLINIKCDDMCVSFMIFKSVDFMTQSVYLYPNSTGTI